MKRVLVVYNPKSSKFHDVERNVLFLLRKKYANLIEYQISPTNFDDNVAKIARLLKENDLVVSAGGDGTAAMASNAILVSQKPHIAIGYLGFGNFNDLASSFTHKKSNVLDLVKSSKIIRLRPLDIAVNGRHVRFAILYATLGLLAKSTLEFEKPQVRDRIKRGKTGLLYSLLVLTKFYFRERQSSKSNSDIIVMNGRRAGGILRTKSNYYASKHFQITFQKLSGLPCLMWFMMKAFFGHTPGKVSHSSTINFMHEKKAVNLDFQSEGEYLKLKKVQELKITKSEQFLNVILT